MQIKHISKRTLNRKTNTFPVFHVENVKFSQCYGFMCVSKKAGLKTNFFYDKRSEVLNSE